MGRRKVVQGTGARLAVGWIGGGAALLLLGAAGTSQAGPGFADAISPTGASFRIPTFFANSPSGARTPVAEAAMLYPGGYPGTGAALRKFIDPLPLLGEGSAKTMADGTTLRYIPLATPEKWVNPQGVITGDDYYELATVEYSQKLHSDLKKPTTLRGYVQLSTARNPGKQIPLTYPDGTPILIQDSNADGTLKFDANGKAVMKPALAFDNPHYLGPAISATKGIPTRIKFHNLLPVGRAVLQTGVGGAPAVDATGQVIVNQRRGDLFLPVDTSLMGAGMGPDGLNTYTQNRTSIHLHGGDTPWISDGTPHQWFTPAGEADPARAGSLASAITDAQILPQYLRGASAANVPDMPEPGPGAMTLYFPNGQSSRLLWYHDHAAGMTRVNVYAGMAAPYVLTDAVEKDLITRGVLPPAADTIPLVLQDKGFVPDDIALQDARWNPTAWGAPGDLWFPHVYETVQDPAQVNSWNQVGRWHYGPWFWPVFPALYPLPSGSYGDVTTTPEAWTDTPLINGVAYPTLTVQPKTYRFRILNGSNDRMMTFNLFQADGTQPYTDPITGAQRLTELKMVPAAVPTNPCPAGQLRPSVINGSTCTPETWPTDGRNGGVPDPASVGPTLYQIGSEGGLLPNVARIEPTPTNPLYDVGRATVLNVDTSGLFLAPAERADVVVDFSQYAGKTLIVYNDMFAPVPAGDPRNDYFTGVGDQSAQGGAEDTKPGVGPNTRTMMQIVVANTTPAAALNESTLATEVPKAYAASQERPIVAQSAYNVAFGTAWTDAQAYAPIYTGSLKMPQFQFIPGGGSGVFNAVNVTAGGAGYVTSPTVTFTGGGASRNATAQATLKITGITVTNSGYGYLVAPAVTIVANGGGGGGATATATLKVTGVTIGNGGSGYTAAPAVTFSLPQAPGGVQATGTATLTAGRVTGITITNPGSGYTAAPTVSIAAPAVGVRALATSTGGVATVAITAPDPTNPASAGGGGYTDLSQVAITFTPSPTGANDANAVGTATGSVFDVTLVDPGTGYTSLPTIGFTGGGGAGAAAGGIATGSILVKPKAIQELFEPTFGRLNATLGTEIPFTSALTQTTIPLGYIDPPTEVINDNETQIWKITHNGVDTHPVHFHLVNVQVINRVGWDGFISPPQPNELGWKETVKMNPLEDIIVAVKAKKPTLPGFGLPNSVRPLDPTQPLGAPFGFTQINAISGQPAVVVNTVANFGWEYVWHCHILGHEENDFMRPIVFDAKEAAPLAPTSLAAVAASNVQGQPYGGVTVSWADNASTEYQYILERAVGATSTAFSTYATLPANSTRFIDTQVSALTTYRYRVTAVGANGSAVSNIANASTPGLPPLAPTAVTGTQTSYTAATVTFTDLSTDETGFTVQASADGGVTWTAFATVARTGTASTGSGTQVTASGTIVGGSSYLFRVASSGTYGLSAWVVSQPVATVAAPPAPGSVTATLAGSTQVSLTWVDTAAVETAFLVQQSVNGGAFTQVAQVTSNSSATTGTTLSLPITVTAGNSYVFRVAAVAPFGNSAWGTSASVSTVAGPNAPTSLTATINSATQVALRWIDASNNETAFRVEQSVNGAAFTTVSTLTRSAFQRTQTGGAVSSNVAVVLGNSYVFRVTALNGTNPGTPATVAVTMAVQPPTGLTATSASATSVQLTWVDGGNLEAGYRVERSTDNATWTVLATTAINATGYLDSGLTTGQLYYYRVTGVNGTAVSTPASASVTVTAPILPATPTGLTASAVRAGTTDTVNFTWTDNATTETSYTIQRCAGTCTATSNWTALSSLTVTRTAAQTSGTGSTSASWTGLPRRTNYSFRVVPVAGATSGAASNVVTLRTP